MPITWDLIEIENGTQILVQGAFLHAQADHPWALDFITALYAEDAQFQFEQGGFLPTNGQVFTKRYASPESRLYEHGDAIDFYKSAIGREDPMVNIYVSPEGTVSGIVVTDG
jgi:hypothetical protein